jgi:Terminase DNA packaging enzyme
MNKLNEKLSDILDVEPINYETTEVVEVKTPVEDDAEFARTNIRELIAKGNSAIDNLLLVANASEHPRAYEVAAGLIKNLADLNKDLLEIQKRKKDLDPTQVKNTSTTNIDKAVFVGSTTELVKFLKNNK